MALGVLRNVKYELFCQGIAKGMDKKEAYLRAGFKSGHGASDLYRRPEIRARIDELLTGAANRCELSRKQILDRMLDDWDASRRLGQMSSALKAGELIGRELHRMFTERKEIGGPGDFDNKTEAELREIIGTELKELGWNEQDLHSLPEPKTTH